MRCLVTGAQGLLGENLVEHLRRQKNEVVEWGLPDNDITAVEQVIDGMHIVAPDVVFHLAALTDVDECEKNPALAMTVNFQGTWALALAAAEVAAKLVYISTDYVFDGNSRRPYRESDRPNPLSVYGRSKLMGEEAVRRNARKWFIVRTSWLFGRGGRNFVNTIYQKCLSTREIKVVADQVGSPTYVKDLCEPLWELAQTEYYGIYHLTNAGWCSWFEFAREIVRLTGSGCEVVPISSEESTRPAPRPKFSVLENRNFRRRFGKFIRPWQEALKEYLDEISAAQISG
ncbi:MAG: dTDP-4-dehydrorhamnose reductase [bacterium]